MILNKFESADHLNQYLQTSIKYPQIIHVDSVQKLFAAENPEIFHVSFKDLISGSVTLDSFDTNIMLTLTGSDQLDAYTQKYAESDKNLYIYPWSKTIYRRTIHPNIPDSVYKKMYNLLKSNGYITAATGNYVTIKNQPITEDQFNSAFSDNEAINDKAIQNILANIQELSADNSYYMKMIGDLENKIHQLEVENNEIRNQLSNKHLTTWY